MRKNRPPRKRNKSAKYRAKKKAHRRRKKLGSVHGRNSSKFTIR